jgi:heme-degrading monooxygenase HmoA
VILERAMFAVKPAAMEQAKEVLAQADGFHSFTLRRGIEQPSTYLLLIEWGSVEDHMHGFRESELFVRWRELIGSYFAAPPEVEHYEAPVVTK